MATYTSVLSLRRPNRVPGDNDVVDVAQDVNANMDTVDLNVNLRICTSSTRPTNPFLGREIYETDTAQARIWNGSTWAYTGTNNSAKGKVGQSTSQVDGASLTSASVETVYLTVTFTAQSDRNYWIEFGSHVEAVASASTGLGFLKVRWKAGAAVANTDAQLGSTMGVQMVQGIGSINSERVMGLFELPAATHATTGNVTVGLFLIVPNAGDTIRFDGNVDRENWLSVRDVGV